MMPTEREFATWLRQVETPKWSPRHRLAVVALAVVASWLLTAAIVITILRLVQP